jgi:D-sedoheptulose 7-phosphate isomerase
VVAAVDAANAIGMSTWALTGEAANPLAEAADEIVQVPAADTATVQELHLVAVHLLCCAVDRTMDGGGARTAALSTWEAGR